MVLQTKNSVIFILSLCCLFMIGCSNDKAIGTVSLDPNVLPSLHAEGVTSLISDSGVTRYNLKTDVWDVYSNVEEPYWHFPQGVYLEKFDSLFVAEGSIKADTAYFYENEELWRLIGNVFVQNLKGETFETSELFWNQKEPANSMEAIYTDKHVRINKGDNVIESNGLKSNQSMSHYKFYNGNMETIVEDSETKQKPDSLSESGSIDLPAKDSIS